MLASWAESKDEADQRDRERVKPRRRITKTHLSHNPFFLVFFSLTLTFIHTHIKIHLKAWGPGGPSGTQRIQRGRN